jgi:hypothetical protein
MGDWHYHVPQGRNRPQYTQGSLAAIADMRTEAEQRPFFP